MGLLGGVSIQILLFRLADWGRTGIMVGLIVLGLEILVLIGLWLRYVELLHVLIRHYSGDCKLSVLLLRLRRVSWQI